MKEWNRQGESVHRDYLHICPVQCLARLFHRCDLELRVTISLPNMTDRCVFCMAAFNGEAREESRTQASGRGQTRPRHGRRVRDPNPNDIKETRDGRVTRRGRTPQMKWARPRSRSSKFQPASTTD